MESLELCYTSAGQLAKLVQSKEVSPVEIIDAHLARIEATEPVLNSFITLLPDEARAAARRAESDIQRGNYLGPLHGIPVGLKDLFNTAGVRTTSAPESTTPSSLKKTAQWRCGSGRPEPFYLAS